MALLSSEGGIFNVMGGMYNKSGKANLEVYLKAHSGDPLNVNRRGREERILRPCLTIGVALQPEVLQAFTQIDGAMSRGLASRFLYSVPKPLKTRHIPSYEEAFRKRSLQDFVFVRRLRRLLQLEMPAAESEPEVLPVTPRAFEILQRVARQVEKGRGSQADGEGFAGWRNKLTGSIIRIAGVYAALGLCDEIREPHARRAALLVGYLVSHARAAFGIMRTPSDVENLKYAVSRLRAYVKRRKNLQITRRDLHRLLQARFPTTTYLHPAIEILQQHNYLFLSGGDPTTAGSPILYTINPSMASR
jgi:hypothetical protein